jgi:Class III cytochrome C family
MKNMKRRLLAGLAVVLGLLTLGLLLNATPAVNHPNVAAFDGTNPPHAVDTDGKAIPESSATQPDKPIILAKDIPKDDPKYGELKPEAAFDHAKHNTDPLHTMDGKTLTACVECHHTEQPSAPAGKPYLKTFNPKRTEVLTVAQLETSKEPVKSCRACHFQKKPPPAEQPPKSVKYPKDVAKLMGDDESGELDNSNAYHLRCITCHSVATDRDPKLKAPKGCPDCHIKKTAPGGSTF